MNTKQLDVVRAAGCASAVITGSFLAAAIVVAYAVAAIPAPRTNEERARKRAFGLLLEDPEFNSEVLRTAVCREGTPVLDGILPAKVVDAALAAMRPNANRRLPKLKPSLMARLQAAAAGF